MRYGTGVVLVFVAGILWSLQGLIFRQIDEAGTWAVLFWRSIGMVPVLTAFVLWRSNGRPMANLRAGGIASVVGAIGLIAAFGGAIYAIQITTIANAVFLFAASPLIAALLGWVLLGEKVRVETWIAIIVAMVGIYVMVRQGLSGGALAGNIAALTSSLGFAVFTVSLRWKRVDDSLPTVVLGGLLSIVTGAVVAQHLGQPLSAPPADILWAMGMGAGTLSGGMVLYTLGSRVVPAAELALLSNIEVLLSPIWVWLFLNETVSSGTLTGGAILLLAVVFNGLSGARRLQQSQR